MNRPRNRPSSVTLVDEQGTPERLVVNVSTPLPEHCHTVPELLRILNMHEASVEKQAAVLRVWLKAHPPGHDLRVSLLTNGYGHILDEAVGRPPRKSPATMKHSA
jgi:hypothetical protein